MRQIIELMILEIIPLLLIIYFSKLDDTIDIKIRKRDIVIITIVNIVYLVVREILYRGIGLEVGTYTIIHLDLIMSYLVFMSYTDQRTKLLYTSVSIVMMIYEIINIGMGLGVEKLPDMIEYKQYLILIIPAITFIISLLGGIGLGDVFIYTVISLYLVQITSQPILIMLISILFTNVTFVISTIIKRIATKNKDKHMPLTIHIAISTVLFSVLTLIG